MQTAMNTLCNVKVAVGKWMAAVLKPAWLLTPNAPTMVRVITLDIKNIFPVLYLLLSETYSLP